MFFNSFEEFLYKWHYSTLLGRSWSGWYKVPFGEPQVDQNDVGTILTDSVIILPVMIKSERWISENVMEISIFGAI